MTNSTGLSATVQIDELQKLKPRAAAFLAGISFSTFRDNVHMLNPDEHGCFDARQVATLSRPGIADKLSGEESELLQKAAEALAFSEHALLIGKGFNLLRERYGAASQLILLGMFKSLQDEFQEDFTGHDIAADKETILRVGRETIKSMNDGKAISRGEYHVVCDGCHAVRFGKKWRKKKLASDALTVEDRCPKCRD